MINNGLKFRLKPRQNHLLLQFCSQNSCLNTLFVQGFFPLSNLLIVQQINTCPERKTWKRDMRKEDECHS